MGPRLGRAALRSSLHDWRLEAGAHGEESEGDGLEGTSASCIELISRGFLAFSPPSSWGAPIVCCQRLLETPSSSL